MLGQDHYLHRLRAACLEQPELNRHQLAALDRELVLSRAAATPEAHLEASGHLLGIARATALDRAANLLATARRYDDPWSAAAAGIEYLHAQQGANHAELYTSINEGHARAALFRAQSNEIHGAFTALFLGLLHVHTSNYELAPAYADIASAFHTLRSSDPQFIANEWINHPRCHRRLPWHCPLIHKWLEPFWVDAAANPPDIPADPSFLIQPGDWGQLDWPTVPALETPSDTAIADAYLRRQSDWPDAVLERHWQATCAALNAARSPIAKCAVAAEREALFSIESTHNQLQLTALLAPLRAAANHGWEQSEASRGGLVKAIETTRVLTGYGPAELLALPRIRHFLEHNLQPRLDHGVEGFGALSGEAGFDLVRHAVACRNVAGHLDFVLLFCPGAIG